MCPSTSQFRVCSNIRFWPKAAELSYAAGCQQSGYTARAVVVVGEESGQYLMRAFIARRIRYSTAFRSNGALRCRNKLQECEPPATLRAILISLPRVGFDTSRTNRIRSNPTREPLVRPRRSDRTIRNPARSPSRLRAVAVSIAVHVWRNPRPSWHRVGERTPRASQRRRWA